MKNAEAESVDVRALAELARIAVSDEDLTSLENELRHILGFVSDIQAAGGEAVPRDVAHRNVLRTDDTPYEPGVFTEVLLGAAPRREGDHVAVRQVLDRGEGTKK